MCIAPSEIWIKRGPGNQGLGFEKIPAPCGHCWRCRSNLVNDYVGRALAESYVSDWTCTLTLTYAPRDDGADKVLVPHHFQTFIRSLRDSHRKRKARYSNREFSLRYVGVGEYGSAKGRAHFHTILFGKGESPEIPHQTNSHIPQWPHGHVFADWAGDESAARYVMKYLKKGEPGDYWFTLSKKPAIGAEWFAQKAMRHVETGVWPRTYEYTPPGGRLERSYLMTGATKRDFIRALLQGMFDQDKTRLSEWVRHGLEKTERWIIVDAFAKRSKSDEFTPWNVPLQEFSETLRPITEQHASNLDWSVYTRATFEADNFVDKLANHPHRWVRDSRGDWTILWE